MNGNETNSDEGLRWRKAADEPAREDARLFRSCELSRSRTVLTPATDRPVRDHFPIHLFKLAGSETYVLPEDHYGGHMDGARGRVDACGWSRRGLSGFVRCRNGARASWGSLAGHRAKRDLRVPASAVLSFLTAPANFNAVKWKQRQLNRGRGRRESRRRTLA